MNTQNIMHLVCPHCGSLNRLPEDRRGAGPNCGNCHQPLFQGHPLALDTAGFARHRQYSDIPLLVDFWASWCAPCRMMAPAFEEAARQLEPELRLAKVNTEEARDLAINLGIRSIPTLVLFVRGQEVARTAGAMEARSIVAWVRQHF